MTCMWFSEIFKLLPPHNPQERCWLLYLRLLPFRSHLKKSPHPLTCSAEAGSWSKWATKQQRLALMFKTGQNKEVSLGCWGIGLFAGRGGFSLKLISHESGYIILVKLLKYQLYIFLHVCNNSFSQNCCKIWCKTEQTQSGHVNCCGKPVIYRITTDFLTNQRTMNNKLTHDASSASMRHPVGGSHVDLIMCHSVILPLSV